MKPISIFFLFTLMVSSCPSLFAMIKDHEKNLCVPFEKHVARDCSLESWIDYIDGKTLIKSGKDKHGQDEFVYLPQEISEKIYEYLLPNALPNISDDLKTLLMSKPEYTKKTPHHSLAIINNRFKKLFRYATDEKLKNQGYQDTYNTIPLEKTWEYLLKHNQPIKDLIDKACKKIALTKIKDYINQLPKPVQEYVKNYAFYPQRWYACVREVCNLPSTTDMALSINNSYSRDLKYTPNTVVTHEDKLYAITRSKDSIIVLNNKTLQKEGQIDLQKDRKINQLAHDHTQNIFYLMYDDGIYRCNPAHPDELESIMPSSFYDRNIHCNISDNIMTIDPENQYLYLNSTLRHVTLRIDLTTLKQKSFDHKDLISDYRKKNSTNDIDDIHHDQHAAQISRDGSQLIVETSDSHIRVYQLFIDREKKDTPIASFKDRMPYAIASTPGITSLNNGSFIYRHTNVYSRHLCGASLGIYKPTNKKIANRKSKGKIPLLPDTDYQYSNAERLRQRIFFRVSKDPNHKVLNSVADSLNDAYITTANNDNQINLFLPVNFSGEQKVIKITPKFNLAEAACLYKLEKLIGKKYSENWITRSFKTSFGSYLYEKYVLFKRLEATNNCPNKYFIFDTCNDQYHYSEALGFTGRILGSIIHKFWKTIGMFDTEGNVASERIAKG